MAATITFRPRAGIREALDARCANGGPDRTAVINAALAQYLGVEVSGPDSSSSIGMPSGEPVPRPDPTMVSERGLGGVPIADAPQPKSRRKARQAVPSPAGEEPPCPHPKESLKRLPYGTQCTECGKMVKP